MVRKNAVNSVDQSESSAFDVPNLPHEITGTIMINNAVSLNEETPVLLVMPPTMKKLIGAY